ncbi:MAG TPA: undecaprenyl-diphosphate phosphatase [Gammaproteobacteria bacterium]|nr:undecaprenyl-diphosphate phosphatase [Gammaproteobacteria bacterium]
MENLHAIYLALLQGLTEFLPISSSAHLILLPRLLGWTDQGLAFDVAVHVGTLLAVLVYFREDVSRLLAAWLRSLGSRQADADARLAWFVILGTIPAAVLGLLLHDVIETWLRSPLVIAAATIGFGVLLGVADWRGRQQRDEHALRIGDVVIIGLSQALALVPGTSRSGITMTAGLALGMTRSAAARFSFLLSIPLIMMAGGYETLMLVQQAAPVDWLAILTGAGVSAVSAWLCIHFFLKLIERIGMMPFVVYRLLLGAVLLWMYL